MKKSVYVEPLLELVAMETEDIMITSGTIQEEGDNNGKIGGLFGE